jgi:ubiquinone/menaquinone biosynthesis C-methylase UbiE
MAINDMKLTFEEKITRESYDKIAKRWSDKNGAVTIWNKEIKTFLKLLGKGKILEIGSGSGRDAEIFVKAGYGYIGTDVSSALLKIARKRVPGAIFLEQSVCELNFPKETRFDGFWTSMTLLHISKNRIDQALQQIKKFVKNRGVGFISIKEGMGEKMESKTADYGSDDKRFFSYYSKEEFENILLRNGFQIIKIKSLKLGGKPNFLCFLCAWLSRRIASLCIIAQNRCEHRLPDDPASKSRPKGGFLV